MNTINCNSDVHVVTKLSATKLVFKNPRNCFETITTLEIWQRLAENINVEELIPNYALLSSVNYLSASLLFLNL